MSNSTKRSGSNRSGMARQRMGGGQSGVCLWRLSGRYSAYWNRGWVPNRPQMFKQSNEAIESDSEKAEIS